MASAAFADTIVVNDLVTGSDATKAPGSTGTVSVYLIAQNDSNGTHIGDRNGCNAGTGSAAVRVDFTSSDPLKVSIASPQYVLIEDCGTENAKQIGYTVASNAAAGSVTISGQASGGKSSSLFNNDSMSVTIQVTNTAPTVPGAPGLAVGSNTPNQGGFTLDWAASTDAQSDPITYELQHKNSAAAATFTTVTGAGALSSPSFTFTTGAPEAEGTWTYQVRASDGSLSSAFSGASSAIKVDRSAPSAPTASFDRTAEYTDGTNDWFKNTVTVSYSGSTDPSLADSSIGSGVASQGTAQTFTTTGTHPYSGAATDNAGNVSSAATGSVRVDASAPVVTLTCPSNPVLLNSTASASWTASDAGSGLATAASGSITLDTSSVGPGKTANAAAGTAEDNVGLLSAATSCTYSVVYDWNGFFSPVENLPAWNSAKAGQSIPVKFSLGGDQGLNIFAANFPQITQISCPSNGTVTDPIEEYATSTANSKLNYDSLTGQYNYVWKTEKVWAGKCFRLDVKLIDGTTHSANFKFTK